MKTIKEFVEKDSTQKTLSNIKKCLIFTLVIVIMTIAGYVYGVIKGGNIKEERIIRTINASVSETYNLNDWEILQMAIAKTESEYNKFAQGKTNDLGIFQITPIYVEEVNRIMDSHMYNTSDAYSIEKSLEMFDIMQHKHNPLHDIDKAIHSHNPNGGAIGYFKKVYDNIVFVKRMEEVRKQILLFEYKKEAIEEAESDNEISLSNIMSKKKTD